MLIVISILLFRYFVIKDFDYRVSENFIDTPKSCVVVG